MLQKILDTSFELSVVSSSSIVLAALSFVASTYGFFISTGIDLHMSPALLFLSATVVNAFPSVKISCE